MTESETPPSSSQSETQSDDKEKLTHVQRTDPTRLWKEYEQYFEDARVKHDETTTKWDRLKLTWYNILAGNDSWEAVTFANVMNLGFVGGFLFGAVNDSTQRINEFKKQHDDFVAAGMLKEKWQLTKTSMFRTAKNGVRMSIICTCVPTGLLCGLMSSVSYRNAVNPVDFGIATAITSALFNVKKANSVILRHSGIAFGLGFAAACAINASFWLTDSSVSDFRYWAVYGRYRANDDMSRKSWEKYRDMPQHQKLYNREINLEKDWVRYREELEQAKQAKINASNANTNAKAV